MKNPTLSLSLAGALLLPLAAACTQDSTKAASPSGSTTTTMKDMGGSWTNQYNDLKRMADTRIATMDTTIADLRAKAAAGTEEARNDIEDLTEQLQAKKIELQKVLADYDMKKASKDSYDNLKTRVDAMVVEINKVIEKAKAKAM